MAFSKEIRNKIHEYVQAELPKEEWYGTHFYPFLKDDILRNKLITEFKNARLIYKIFEGLQAENELLLAEVKTQVILFASIQEAVVDYVLYKILEKTDAVQNLLTKNDLVRIDIPQAKKEILKNNLIHDGKNIICYYEKTRPMTEKEKFSIRYRQKINALSSLGVISEDLAEDLKCLYEYRNTIHIESDIKKNLSYDLEMGKLAYRRVEGLSIEISKYISDNKVKY